MNKDELIGTLFSGLRSDDKDCQIIFNDPVNHMNKLGNFYKYSDCSCSSGYYGLYKLFDNFEINNGFVYQIYLQREKNKITRQGYQYFFGLGLPRDAKMAWNLFSKESNISKEAFFGKYLCLYLGKGINRNIELADEILLFGGKGCRLFQYELYNRIINKTISDKKIVCFKEASPPSKHEDSKEAKPPESVCLVSTDPYYWLKKSAKKEDPRAMCDLALLILSKKIKININERYDYEIFENDKNSPNAASLAIMLLDKSSRRMNDLARYALAVLIDNNYDKDKKLIFNLYYSSAILGNIDAMRDTAVCFLTGDGVEESPETALFWLKLLITYFKDKKSESFYNMIENEIIGKGYFFCVYCLKFFPRTFFQNPLDSGYKRQCKLCSKIIWKDNNKPYKKQIKAWLDQIESEENKIEDNNYAENLKIKDFRFSIVYFLRDEISAGEKYLSHQNQINIKKCVDLFLKYETKLFDHFQTRDYWYSNDSMNILRSVIKDRKKSDNSFCNIIHRLRIIMKIIFNECKAKKIFLKNINTYWYWKSKGKKSLTLFTISWIKTSYENFLLENTI